MIVIVTVSVFDAVAHLAVLGTNHRTARERTMTAVTVCLCVCVCVCVCVCALESWFAIHKSV